MALRKAFMHDGRFTSLEEVVRNYSAGVQPSETLDPNLAKHPPEGLRLSEADVAALMAFLNALSDESLPSPENLSNPH